MMQAAAAEWKMRMLPWTPVEQVVDWVVASVGSMLVGLCAIE